MKAVEIVVDLRRKSASELTQIYVCERLGMFERRCGKPRPLPFCAPAGASAMQRVLPVASEL